MELKELTCTDTKLAEGTTCMETKSAEGIRLFSRWFIFCNHLRQDRHELFSRIVVGDGLARPELSDVGKDIVHMIDYINGRYSIYINMMLDFFGTMLDFFGMMLDFFGMIFDFFGEDRLCTTLQ